MAWTTPNTAVAGTVWTAADFNVYIRDNLLETGPGLPTVNGRGYFVAVGDNEVANREMADAVVLTAQSVASNTYTDLATVGPSVTIATGTNAVVFMNTLITSTTGDDTLFAHMSYEVSGATAISPDDSRSIYSSTGTTNGSFGFTYIQSELTPGNNTFTAKYRRDTGSPSQTFQNRRIAVMPL